LEGVLGIVQRAEHPVAVSVELAAVFVDQAAESRFVGITDQGHGIQTAARPETHRSGPRRGY
jgi:hypothetical protein